MTEGDGPGGAPVCVIQYILYEGLTVVQMYAIGLRPHGSAVGPVRVGVALDTRR